MKVRIAVGDVEIEVDGMDMSKADVARWFKRAALVAAALASSGPADTSDGDGVAVESKDTDAHLTLSGDGVPLFGFTRWMPEDPEWVPEEAP